MGKSSPTKLQLKHIPDVVILETIFCIQNQWTVWVGSSGEIYDESFTEPMRRLSYRQKRMAHLAEICEVLKPLPEKLIWRKLLKLEDQRKIESYGPASIRFRVVE
jgi:hypothetical protein